MTPSGDPYFQNIGSIAVRTAFVPVLSVQIPKKSAIMFNLPLCLLATSDRSNLSVFIGLCVAIIVIAALTPFGRQLFSEFFQAIVGLIIIGAIIYLLMFIAIKSGWR